MLSYQHMYHAGCLADVHKHAVLAILLHKLTEKPKPLTYMETHAGRGLYSLKSEAALKTGEAVEGVERLLRSGVLQRGASLFAEALQALRGQYGDDFYPGSPCLARHFLREGDSLHLMELHPQEHEELRLNVQDMAGKAAVHVHRRDGYEGVLALSPPVVRRGLVLVDPSYEVKAEYAQAADFAKSLHRKWGEAVVALWYPLLAEPREKALVEPFLAAGFKDVTHHEVLFAGRGQEGRMKGSGMLILNTPYGIEEKLKSVSEMFAG